MRDSMAGRVCRSTDMPGLLGRRLNDIEQRHAPSRVYCEGSMRLPLRGARVSVVGTRNPTVQGRRLAVDIAGFLAERGATVVSGLASGIDAAAHGTAMERGGRTVAVLGTPLNRAYPRENAALQRKIMEEHLAVSQYPVGHATARRDFVFRNRTMALISDASIMVEAGDGSGTLHHGREALRLGRPLFISGLSLRDPGLGWPKQLMDCGAIELGDFGRVSEFLSRRAPTREPFHRLP